MGSRVLHGTVALAVVASTGLIGLLLGAPFLPGQATSAPSPSTTAAPSATVAPGMPPIGLFELRGMMSSGHCIALELEPQSYPVSPDAPGGTATILWWAPGMTGCDTRSTEVTSEPATVTPVDDEDEPEEAPTGYAVRFSMPADARAGSAAPSLSAELTILARQSTQALIQAVETMPVSGTGLVLDRVESVGPELMPVPSPTPVTTGPNGVFLLRGRLGPDGPCLVLELGQPSYPSDGVGQARIRTWQPATPDPSDPAQCLRRAGAVEESDGTIMAVGGADDPAGLPIGYVVSFQLALPGAAAQAVELHIPLETATPDALEATVLAPRGIGPLAFDRVDSIDPPLGPAPSASPGD